MTQRIVKTFTATGTSSEARVQGPMNISIQGASAGSATIELQRKYSGSETWETTDTFTSDFSGIGDEVEEGVTYRFNCTDYTSGTIVCRIGG